MVFQGNGRRNHGDVFIRIKAGVHLKAAYLPVNLGLMRISSSRFKLSKNSLLITQIYGLRCFVNFLGGTVFDHIFKHLEENKISET